MAEQLVEIGVVAARRRLKSLWQDEAWTAHAALPAPAPVEAGTVLADTADEKIVYLGAEALHLHSAETAHYRDNLASATPSVWIALRIGPNGPKVASVTVDPYEGEAMAETVDQIVEAVAMPSQVRAALAEFVERHHVERPFVKRKRDGARQDRASMKGNKATGPDVEAGREDRSSVGERR